MTQINRKRYVVGQGSTLVDDFSTLYAWDSIDTTSKEGATRFYIGNAYIEVVDNIATPSNGLQISCALNNYVLGTIKSGSGGLYINTVKNEKTVVITLSIVTSSSEYITYSGCCTIVVGEGTNVVTGVKESVIAYYPKLTINSFNVTGSNNKSIVCSSEITATSFSLLEQSNISFNSASTMLIRFGSDESQVVMDNVYITHRCSLETPSLGECMLNGKKYYMCYHIWVPYEE